MESLLIEQCIQGNRKAQYHIYQQYSQAMFNICLRMMGSVEDAEDMLQEAFVNAFAKISQFKGGATFGAWLKRIVINQCINSLRSKKNMLTLNSEWDAHDVSEQLEDDNLPTLSVGQVKDAIQQLPDGFRIVLSLYLLEGYDHQEIGDILGVSPSTSKSQYSRAKAKLREILKDHSMAI